MRLLDGLLGNASETDTHTIQLELAQLLAPGEEVRKSYVVIRDLMVFTTKRLLLIDKQGVTGKKREYMSIPYRSIERYSTETTGHFDLDAELKIWVKGMVEPISKTFRDNTLISDVGQTLSEYAL